MNIEDFVINVFRDKTDLASAPYHEHLFRVAAPFYGELRSIALLHDILEDTSVTEETLRLLFSPFVVDTVVVLTRKDETYEDYIEQVKDNEYATLVKIEDLKDNLNITRLAELTDKDISRLKRYFKAYKYLTND